VFILILGNKTDLSNRSVTAAERFKLARSVNGKSLEMSAKDQTGIKEMKKAVAGKVSARAIPGFPQTAVLVESNSLSAVAVSATFVGQFSRR
jgi:Fe2+ transport system protein B